MGDSMWKKEISLRRKRPAVEDAAPTAAPAPAPAKQSFWKKEISLGGKPKANAVPAATTAPTPAAAPPKQSFWKKEISFGGKAKPEPVPPAPAVPEERPSAVERVLAPAETPALPATPPVPVPVPVAQVPAAPAPAPTPAPAASAPVADVPATADPVPVPPAAVPVAQPTVATEPPAASIVAAVPAPVEPVPAPVVVPTPQPGPVAPPVAVPVAHAPAPAAPLPQPEPEKKPPFWKRELSFGRKRAEAPAAAAAEAPDAEKSVPFWKKDFSLGRNRTPKAEAPRDEHPKVPFWKRELGRTKVKGTDEQPDTPKQPKAPKMPKAPRVRGGGGNSKRVVGLKVGASQVAAARVANNGVAELLQIAREPLEPGIVVGGELREPDALAETLKTLFKRHKLPKKGVRLGIANNRIGVRTFEISGIDDPKQLANAIRFRAQEVLPIPIDEAVLDYQILGETTDEDGRTVRRVLLVVAYRELIDRYVEACRKAGITLSGIDLEAFALLRALSAPRPADEEPSAAVVAVAIGHERSTFAVSDGRVCEFTRVLDWGGSALDVAIARALDIAPSEAEPVKRVVPLGDDRVPEGLTADQTAKARDAMRKQIQAFARELVSSLQFYQSQPGSFGIGEIILTGGTSNLPGLADELQRLIGVRVRVGDPLARMKVGKRIAGTEQLGSLAVAIGLGIDD